MRSTWRAVKSHEVRRHEKISMRLLKVIILCSSCQNKVSRTVKLNLRRLHRVFSQCWCACQRAVFMFSIFKVTKRFRLSFAVVNIIKMIFIIMLRLQEGRRSPAIVWLCLWISSICFGEISQNFQNKNNPADHLQAEVWVIFLYLKFGLIN